MSKESETQNRPLILAIETGTRAGSIAVARGEQVMSLRAGDESVSHSTNLIEMIQAALQEAEATLSDVDLFAAAVGPGSFTGLRIGLATVKAFAACTGRQLVGVSTLAAIAHGANGSAQTLALLPAGRGEVFAQMFSAADGEINPLDTPAHLSPNDLLEKYGAESNLTWAGEVPGSIAEQLRSPGRPPEGGTPNASGNSNAIQGGKLDCLAVSIAALALREYREGKSVTPEELHAVYVRPSDAEINERWQREKAGASAQK